MTTTDDRPAPGDAHKRKQQVLTKGRASVVGSITDAVVAKNGEPFFLCPPDGQVPVEGRHGFGLYHHDCRFLSGYELTIAGQRPESLAATSPDAAVLVLELTNADVQQHSLQIRKDQLGLTWTRRIDADGPALRDAIEVRNFGTDDVDVPVEVRFRAGFEDVFEIRGLVTEHAGTHRDPKWTHGHLELGYEGSDGVDRVTRISVSPSADPSGPTGATLRLHVPARDRATVEVEVRIEEHVRKGAPPMERRTSPGSRPRANEGREPGEADRPSGDWIGGHGWATSLRTSSFALRAAIGRSLDDLGQLRGELGGLRYYEAGIPWFATLFGRDSLIAALQSLPFDPAMAADTLRLLAHRQGTKVDDWRSEQPGKILHELRIGELARTGQIPQTPYYGTVDATPLFLILLAEHAAWTGSLDLFTELREHVDAALGWLDRYGDTDGDGFVDYRSHTDRGLANQGWKDSGDAIVDADGSIAQPPIALAEVQGYAWRAWTDIAGLLERAGDADHADRLRRRAADLAGAFEDRFWSDDLGCYVLALANGNPCDVVASNAGQVLWTGIAGEDRARRVAERLMQPDMFSGWGVRTLSRDAVAFHPIGYHLGTVWPHDNSMIASGFRRYGQDDAAERIFLGLLEAGQDFPDDRLPECFAGFGRERFSVPVRYPVACHPQAWSSGTIPYLLTTMLGLQPDGFANRLGVVRPRLPVGIEVVELRELPVGRGTAHLRFERRDGGTRVEVLEIGGGLSVDVVPAGDSGR